MSCRGSPRSNQWDYMSAPSNLRGELGSTRRTVLLSSLLIIVSVLNASSSTVMQAAPVDVHGLKLQARLTRSSYSIGEDLILGLSLQNTQTTPITMVFPSSQRFDFSVLNREGKELYRWSRDKAFLTVISEVTLSPGESIDEELSWKIQDVPPGEYTVTGETAEFFIDGQKQKLASSSESVTINETAVPEFVPGLVAFLSAGVILIALVLNRWRKKLSSQHTMMPVSLSPFNHLTTLDAPRSS